MGLQLVTKYGAHRTGRVSSAGVMAGAAALSMVAALSANPTASTAQGMWDPYGLNGRTARARVDASRARLARRDGDRQAARFSRGGAEQASVPKAAASGPLLAVVSLSAQRMTVYDATGPIIRSPISSGKAGHRTPTGVFSVLQKNRHHVSNIYSGAPMPFMQRLTWSGIALHAGVLPGYPASAGCIRLPHTTAAQLFALSKLGMRVVVAPNEPTPASFSHPALPEPKMVAVPPAAPTQQATAGADANTVATRFLNPMQVGQQERQASKLRVVEAHKMSKARLEESQRASAEANQAAGALRVAQAHVDALKMRLAQTSEAEQRRALDAQIVEAEAALVAARSDEAAKSKAAFAAAVASREAEDAIATAEEQARIAERGTEPIAVFISRRESKVFVRQGMVPLFDAPVTFKDPSRPLGTHVFQVMAADNASGRLSWNVVTVPETISLDDAGGLDVTGSVLDNRGPVRRGGPALRSVGLPSDAQRALERVEMSPEVRQRIAERLWVNGSITISDHGISNETGKGTDFVVLTRGSAM